jgi:L-aminopeptidase/D-esterase-like protein
MTYDSITDVTGIQVGHAEDLEAITGCTVVLCGEGAVVGVDVRGQAPGTRETDLCRPGTLVEHAQAVLLTGGSAFGLNAASGVMRYLFERGLGFPTAAAPVPIVPGAVIYDLNIGQVAWPDDAMGYEACERASGGEIAQGCVGAGTGAAVGWLLGPDQRMKSGVGTASVRLGPATVGALVVVNALGDVVDPETGQIIAGARDPASGAFVNTVKTVLTGVERAPLGPTQTVIGVIATDAALSSEQINHLATAGHDGLARAIRPVHTMYDGDTLFGLATGRVEGHWSAEVVGLATATAAAVERAVLGAVRHATPLGGLPAVAQDAR